MTDAVARQRAYYTETAAQYDRLHVEPEHQLALELLAGFVEAYDIRSVLDVGAGTGRAMGWIKRRFPDRVVKGVEPVEALRAQGYAKGIPESDLLPGDGYRLPFKDQSFDLVCEFAVLHHVPEPDRVVAEMSRVASRMVGISDCNFMGQGPAWLRAVKGTLFTAGLWPAANWVKTRGKGYTYSEGDGIAYSYSVYQSLKVLRRGWHDIRIIRTAAGHDAGRFTRFHAPHVLAVCAGRKGR